MCLPLDVYTWVLLCTWGNGGSGSLVQNHGTTGCGHGERAGPAGASLTGSPPPHLRCPGVKQGRNLQRGRWAHPVVPWTAETCPRSSQSRICHFATSGVKGKKGAHSPAVSRGHLPKASGLPCLCARFPQSVPRELPQVSCGEEPYGRLEIGAVLQFSRDPCFWLFSLFEAGPQHF